MSDLAATLPSTLRAPNLGADAPPPPTDPATTGLSPAILGNPIVALIGQLNRFRKAQKAPELPLWPQPVTPALANEALRLLKQRLDAAYAQLPDPNTLKQLNQIKALVADRLDVTRMTYVTVNLAMVTQQLALYGNMLGLPAAKVGVTKDTDPTAPKEFPWVYVAVGLGVLVLGGGAYWVMRQRPQLAPAT